MISGRYIFSLFCAALIATQSHGQGRNKHMESRDSRPPKFIPGIYLNCHNHTCATDSAIDREHYPEAVFVSTNNGADATDEDTDEGEIVSDIPAFLSATRYAEMVGLDPKAVANAGLYLFVEKWYGTRYRYGGTDHSGIDCSAFSQKLYGEVYGVDLLRTAMEQYRSCKKVKTPANAKEGDLVFFRRRSKRISHVGVYLANNYFVHASSSQGVVISNLSDSYWQKHYAGIGKVKRTGRQL